MAAPRPGPPVDLLVIGGGVNGAGIARDAAGRGLSLILCEKDDLAQATSSGSGKLMHGGQLNELEARFLRQTEWATEASDILTRRTKHCLHLTDAQRAAFEAFATPAEWMRAET